VYSGVITPLLIHTKIVPRATPSSRASSPVEINRLATAAASLFVGAALPQLPHLAAHVLQVPPQVPARGGERRSDQPVVGLLQHGTTAHAQLTGEFAGGQQPHVLTVCDG
jgi:hypothetical protein